MRFRLLAVLLTLCLPVTTAFAQDELPAEEGASPEAGDTSAEVGATETTEMTTDEAPASDAGDKPVSVGLLLGYGLDLNDGDLNPWGLGFGIKGGYNLDAIYLGARFVYYLGDTVDIGPIEFKVNIIEIGAEFGYDVDLGGASLRPGVGLGIALAGGDADGSDIYFAPGVGVNFDVSDSIFLGAEGRFKFVLSDPSGKGIIFLANAGMRF